MITSYSPSASSAGATFAACTVLLAALALCSAVAVRAEVPGQDLGEIVAEVVDAPTEPTVEPDDGFFEWFERHIVARQELRRRTATIRSELGVLAKEKEELRARFLKLLFQNLQLIPPSQWDPGMAPFYESFLGVSSLDGLLGAWREIAADNLHRSGEQSVDPLSNRLASLFGAAPLPPLMITPGQATEVRLRRRRDEVAAQIRDKHTEQAALIDEALTAHEGLVAEAEAQLEAQRRASELPGADPSHRRKRLMASSAIFELEDQSPLLKLQLYDAAEWYNPRELPALLAELDPEKNGDRQAALLLRAKADIAFAESREDRVRLQLASPRQAPPDLNEITTARTARTQALVQLRKLLRLEPEHAEARALIKDQELYWLREIAAKLEREKNASLRAFHDYLEARGFSPRDPENWWQGLADVASSIWGLGWGTGLAGWMDVPGALEGQVSADQELAVKHHMGLFALQRLVKSGLLLTEMSDLGVDELRERMAMTTVSRRQMPIERANRLLHDVEQTLDDLTDLRHLASGEDHALERRMNMAFGASYYQPVDPTYAWYEAIGDVFNLHNVVTMWAPGAVFRIRAPDPVTGQLRYRLATVTPISDATLWRAGADSAQLLTVRQAMSGWASASPRIGKLAARLQKSPMARAWAAAAERDLAARAGLGGADLLADTSFRLGSALVLYGSAGYIAAESGIPGAQLLVELVPEIGPGELLRDAMAQSGVSTGRLLQRVDDLAGRLVQREARLAQQAGRLAELDGLAARLADAGGAATAEGREVVRRATAILEEVSEHRTRMLGEGAADAVFVPGTVDDAVDESIAASARALVEGNASDATRATRAGTNLVEEAADDAQRVSRRIHRTNKILKEAGTGGSFVPRAPEAIEPIRRVRDPEKFWQPDLYTDDDVGRAMLQGDLAIRGGSFEDAIDSYKVARQEIQKRPPIRDTGDPDVLVKKGQNRLVHDRLELLTLAQEYRAGRAGAAARVVDNGPDLTPDEISNLLLHFHPEVTGELVQAGASRTIEAADGTRVVMKRLDGSPARWSATSSDGSSYTLRQISAIGEAGGSANEVWRVTGPGGESYVFKQMRPGGDTTMNMTPAEVEQAMAADAAAANLGRALDLPVPSTHYARDEGFVISRGIEGAEELHDSAEFVALAFRKEYARQRAFRAWLGDSDGHLGNQLLGADGQLWQIDFDMAVLSGTTSRHFGQTLPNQRAVLETVTFSHQGARHRPYAWMARLDQTVSYRDMAGIVGEIRDFVSRDGGAELRRILERSGFADVDGALATLTERAGLLESQLGAIFDVHLAPLPDWYGTMTRQGDVEGSGCMLPFAIPRCEDDRSERLRLAGRVDLNALGLAA